MRDITTAHVHFDQPLVVYTLPRRPRLRTGNSIVILASTIAPSQQQVFVHCLRALWESEQPDRVEPGPAAQTRPWPSGGSRAGYGTLVARIFIALWRPGRGEQAATRDNEKKNLEL
ncbi:hypothetical protein CORC01_03774 [Colletotrichum orchidophilum]|uniref:Uncharacterized protein n=1 Tax=Colletotrichum orchidophilum TaxID=1209926 RepID=A0A1G4BHY5_9PEZI|nr:uncharacterized protein CORC01_03774 [Colletotrichum orchidophilum]OHF00946.1 hypothetical protein CORC01_03774 [Colletotrichum orchidophilum]